MSATVHLSQAKARSVLPDVLAVAFAMPSATEARLIIERLGHLIMEGEPGVAIMRRLNPPAILDARDVMTQRRDLAHGHLTEPSIRVPDPTAPPKPPKKRGRPAEGTCTVCGETFTMNPHGRPASRCPTHRTGASS